MNAAMPAPELLRIIESPEGAALLPGAVHRKLRRNQTLCAPTRPDNHVFIVRSGRLRVHLASEERELTLAFLGYGDVYATHTPAWVTAVEPSEVLVIDARAFSGFLQRQPWAMGAVMRALGGLLGHTIEVVENLVFRDAHERLAHYLAATTRRHGLHGPEGWTVRMALTVTEIALLLGSTRQTVSSAFNAMQRQGVIRRLGRQQLLIADLAALEAWRGARSGPKKPAPCVPEAPDVGQPTDHAKRTA